MSNGKQRQGKKGAAPGLASNAQNRSKGQAVTQTVSDDCGIWKFNVVVESTRPNNWPTKAATIKVQQTGGKATLTKGGQGGSGSGTVKFNQQVSTKAPFGGRHQGGFIITCTLAPEDTACWDVVDTGTQSVRDGYRPQEPVKLHIKPKLTVFLKLKWLDPETVPRLFPKDFPVTVVYDDGTSDDITGGDDGLVSFAAKGTCNWFTLRFGNGTVHYISSAPGAPGPATETLRTAAAVKIAQNVGHRFFALPDNWNLRRSAWDVPAGSANYYNANERRFALKPCRKIGSAAAPVEMTLDPHWQYNRFEFFDRWYGQLDAPGGHGKKRVSIPLLPIEGYIAKVDVPNRRATISNWMYKPTVEAEACHALPWIIRRTEALVEQEKPDTATVLRIATDGGVCVESTSATERKAVKITDLKRLNQPSADRLKLYDLPLEWLSTGYYTRFSNAADNDLYENLDQAKHTASRVPATHFTFCLDDIVVCKPTLYPAGVQPADRLAVFQNEFGKEGGGPGDRSDLWKKVGLYKPDSGNDLPFYSYVDGEPGGDHITDYPDWTRLVIYKGNLYDVFDQRTSAANGHTVVGARAAVCWLDLVAGNGVGKEIKPRAPINKTKPFIALQPCYEQRYSQYGKKHTGPGTPTWGIGRFDQALLRCCGHDGQDEIIMSLHYFRLKYDTGEIPVISNVTAEATDTVATVRWDTDIDAWKNNGDADDRDSSNAPIMRKSFSMTKDGLAPATAETFKLKAEDYCGNWREVDYTLTTKPAAVAPPVPPAPVGGGPPPPAPAPPPVASGPVPVTMGAENTQQTPLRAQAANLNPWAASACTNIMARFNGNDTALSNDKRAEFIPHLQPALPIKGRVIYLIEPAADEARAHFKVGIGSADQGRCYMSGSDGTGTYKHSSNNPENDYCAESYTAAHELGHGGSLPDEYNERWSSCSQDEISFTGRLPGDPFEPDGRRDPGAAGGTVDAASTAMMNGALTMRNRYYWHAAEFARFVTGVDFKVILGAFNEYRVPPHPNYPQSNYNYWPIEELIDSRNGFSMSGQYVFRTKYAELKITVDPAASDVKAKTATIKWTTSHEANSLVEYGTATGAYTNSKPVVESVKEHTVSLDGLTPSTPYFYRVKSVDNDGNQAYSAEATFDTIAVPPLNISVAPATAGVTDTQATIQWTTDRAADTVIEYGDKTGVYPHNAKGDAGAAAHTVHLAGLKAATEYFYKVKSTDSEGAVATSDELKFTTAAAAVLKFSTAPASSAPTQNGVTLTCKTSEAATTEVEYGLDTSYGSTQAMSAGTTDHTVTLAGLAEGKIYHYRIKATPAAGTPIYSADATFETKLPKLEIVGGKIFVTDLTDTTATVSWTTNREANSETECGLDVNAYPAPVVVAALTKEHRVYLTGLEVNRLYKVRATSRKDPDVSDQVEQKFYTSRAAGPPMEDIEARATKNSVTITWNTKEGSDSQIEYGLTAEYGTKTEVVDKSQVTAHQVTITGLKSGATYHYRVHSVDLSKLPSISGDMTFTTPDAIQLSITDVKATGITTTTAEIGWTTSATADSTLEYGIGAGPKTELLAKAFVKVRRISLSALTPGTTYTYNVRSVGEDGVAAALPGFTFKTIAVPVDVTAVKADPVGDTTATITWSTTAIESNSKVEYGLTTAYGSIATDDKAVKDHKIELTGLALGKQYHYRVTSVAGEASGLSPDATFTTKSAQGPVITSVVSSDVKETTAKVTWVTDVEADMQVEYGETTDYGKLSPLGAAATNHSVDLADLTPGTDYHYRVRSTAAGNLSVSADATFKTLVRAPQISNVVWEQLSSNQVRITWDSDIDGNSQVKWGDAAPAPDYTSASPVVAGPLKKHSITLTVPAEAKTYHFGCFTTEPSADKKVGNSPDDTFQVAVTGQPIITDVRSDAVTTTSANILWDTDVPADTELEWGASDAYGTTNTINQSVTGHTVTLTDLKPGTTYYCRAKSKLSPPLPATYDLLLYAAGRERFTDGILTRGPYQGLLQIVSRIKLDFPEKDGKTFSGDYLIRFRAAVLNGFNGPSPGILGYRSKGVVRKGKPEEWDMDKVFVRFVPQFLVTNQNDVKAVAKLENEFGVHANIVMQYKVRIAWGKVTKGDPTELEFDFNHGLETGDVIGFSGIAAGWWDFMNGKKFEITKVDDTHISIAVDSSAAGPRKPMPVTTYRRHRFADAPGNLEPHHLSRLTVDKHGLTKGTQVYLATNTLGGGRVPLGGFGTYAIEDENTLLFNKDISALGAYPGGGARIQTGWRFLTIDSITPGTPTVVTIKRHHLMTGESLNIYGGSGTWAGINGSHSVTLETEDTVSIPVDSSGFGPDPGTCKGISFEKDMEVTAWVDVPSTAIYASGHGKVDGDVASLEAVNPAGDWGAVAAADQPVCRINSNWYAIPVDCSAAAAGGAYAGDNHLTVRPGIDLTLDLTLPNTNADFDNQILDIYSKLVGLADRNGRKKENYTPLVKRIIPQGGVVEDR